MDNKEIIEKINSFPSWRYQFNLKGNLTMPDDEPTVIRHKERKRYFFNPIVDFYGGSLSGKRVLDLASCSGYWSLNALKNGCDRVVGIEGRQMCIDQANFVFDLNDADKDRYDFIKGNILQVDFKQYGPIDIVFCFGIFYHINKPLELMEKIAALDPELVVFDTTLSTARGSFFQVIFEDTGTLGNAIDYELVFHPTREAMRDLARQFGFEMIMLKPNFTSYEGSAIFERNRRKAFVLSRKLDLSTFPAETEPIESYQPPKKPLWKRLFR